MALSMFLRTPARLAAPSSCFSRVFSQQMARLAAQTVHRSMSACLPASTVALKDAKMTPIFDAMRSFSTSPARLSDETPHDHAKMWVIEKTTSAILIVLIPLALAVPNKILDSAMAILITAHSFWGLEAIAVDYVRASIFGPVIPKIAIGLVYAISIATLGGLFYIITHDVGISNTIRNFWAIKSEQKA
uniref:Succinate dehydrogenase [ubiquinone] cytochrome b small subunit n=1 Tax=Pectinophora gossypiella TaxID=13191 RepID=A0A1E1WR06_PECGO